jgi:UDPglucose--hexose-1-phosphate uridylyltransferase
VIIANERGKRPVIFGEKFSCPFCKGSEKSTPPTKFALPSDKDWRVRAFDNVFALVGTEGRYIDLNSINTISYAYGKHELIVETDVHEELFHELGELQLKFLFNAYKHRYEELMADENAKYVHLFKNHGRNAGASIEHEHSQILSLPFVPELILREINASKNAQKQGKCLFCDLLSKEAENVLIENDFFTAICPSFSRFANEIWILPKAHIKSMSDLSEEQGVHLMKLLKACIQKVHYILKDYNVVWHNSPKGEELHFHLEIYPRSGYWAGVELGTGVIVNQKSEKDALTALKSVKV